MVEIKTLIDGKKLEYTGLFRVNELYDIIKNFFDSRSYLWLEFRNREEAMPDGKHVYLTIGPARTVNDYFRTQVKMDIVIKGIKDREIIVDGHKQKYQHGSIKIEFYALIWSDYRNKWEGNGFLFLMRTISEKFIRRDIMKGGEEQCIRDCMQIQDEIKSYLNMSRFSIVHETHQEMMTDKPA